MSTDLDKWGEPARLAQVQRIGCARFGESSGAKDAAVTSAAGGAIGRRIVATVRQPIVQTELETASDDVGLGERHERCVHAEARALHTRSRCQRRQRLECTNELPATIWLT